MITDGLWFVVNRILGGIVDLVTGLFNLIVDGVYTVLVWLITEMISLISKFPLLSEVPELYEIWQLMSYTSFTCIGLIIVYLATKKIGSAASAANNIQMQVIFSRVIYAGIFVAGSRLFIDLLIQLNNILVEVFVIRFDIKASFQNMKLDDLVSNIVITALIGYQIYLAIKIMIGYWLRVAEVFLIYVVSPAFYVLWVNPSWGGFLSSWIQRLVTLVFSQFIQIIIMIIYSKLIVRFFVSGSISNVCLATAFLILMHNTPTWLQRHLAPDSSVKIMSKTFNKTKKVGSKVKSKLNRFRKVKT